MRIGIDVDGVLACFFRSYEDLVVEVAGADLFPARYPDALPPTWNWPEHYGYSKDVISEVWRRIKSSHTFWTCLEALPGASELLETLNNMSGAEVYFITDRPGVEAQLQTQLWLRRNGYMIPSVIISCRGKGIVAKALSLDVYIDDKTENLEDVVAQSPETRVVRLAYPYNRHVPGTETVHSLAEFAESLQPITVG